VQLLDDKGEIANTVKARDLAGQSDLLFRRDTLSGAVQCLTNKSAIALNEELHKHN
jgi:2,3,4,5-tetrahydropyridine-2-carboxylate N-succinyltransferase